MPLPNSDSFATYGSSKVDYSAVVDPTTDRSSVEVNSAFASTSQMTRTAIRAYVEFDGYAGAPTVSLHNATWGNSLSVLPVITHPGTGEYVITFPATVADILGGDAIAVNFQSVQPMLQGNSFALVQASITAPNVVTVYTADVAGFGNDLVGVPITVWII